MSVSKLDELQLRDKFLHRKTDATHPFHKVPRGAVDGIARISGYQYYATDFLTYAGPNTAGEAGGWTLTETACGLGGTNRVDIDNSAQFGKLLLATDDADNDLENLQMTGEPWRYVVGKQLWFFCEFEISDANDCECFLGLAITDTSLIASGPSDGLFFEKAETATALDFNAVKDTCNVEDTTIAHTLADATARIIGFYVDTNGDIHVYDGLASSGIDALTEVATVQAGSASIPDDEDLAISFSIQAGAACTTETLALDWLFVCQER